MNEIIQTVDSEVFAIWFLIGAALVFFMQAGFAMVETGFTRAKNAANIIMKNLMDFCIGTPMFVLIGFGLFMGEDLCGLIGKPGFDVFTAYANFDWSNFVFNLVFCATAATIVSGAMAERTKFLSYCVYSGVISALVYPIEAHWIWGGGWLAQLGFHDFAGSCAIHMVGGIAALVGAKILGPRIGKFSKKSDGSIQPNAIPGHNLTLGALGCFILWFGWYGFNGAACTSTGQLASVFVTTTVAPAIATVTCMIFTWVKYGKPDVSMCLNASLAGLVGITAGCDVMDVAGAGIVGIVSGLLVCFGVWLLDYVLHIDDPVGAVAVHMMNGIWGTIAVGLFATTSAPGNDTYNGLFYGGGFSLLGTQLLGFAAVASWAAITMTIVFFVIKKTIGLRASEQEEILGMDATEHGLVSSYADFMPAMSETAIAGYVKGDAKSVTTVTKVPAAEAVPVENNIPNDTKAPKMTKIAVVFNQEKLHHFIHAMERIGITGVTVTNVMGCGIQKSNSYYRGAKMSATLHPKIKAEIVVCKVPVDTVVKTAREVLYTGQVGDGKIFIYPVERVIKVRTGSVNYDALQSEEMPETN
ncbi:MAG: ammonium transporter [Oscillospiraceae bacterium]|nr:ammonium transporter [Oscillospiraceae bacterium]MCR4761123.1 ammonium transporter [Oscillospiraceae bacterium]